MTFYLFYITKRNKAKTYNSYQIIPIPTPTPTPTSISEREENVSKRTVIREYIWGGITKKLRLRLRRRLRNERERN